MKLFTAFAALTLIAAPAEANYYTHSGTYGNIHCKSTLSVYGKHSFSKVDCTNPEERASRARAREVFHARVKQQEAKMGFSCSDYSKTAVQVAAARDGFVARYPGVYARTALLYCQGRVQAGKLPDGVGHGEGPYDEVSCTDPSISDATKKAMGCV